MAEKPRGEEETSSYDNPFDAQSSDRDHFPSFEAALADEQQVVSSVLDWSIDTLAELKPVPFSPLPHQKNGRNSLGTPHGTSGFFEDETQYEVLRTPLPRESAVSTGRSKVTLTPSSSPPLELHRRCRETIDRCEARLRERQRKMDKLQAVLPLLTPHRSPRQRTTHARATPLRSTPPRPVKRNRLSFAASPASERKSLKPPTWSASPIVMVDSKQPLCATPATLHFDVMTPSPLLSTPTKESWKTRLSFGLSPIAFSSPVQAEREEKSEEEKPSVTSCNEQDTLPLSSTEESGASLTPESEKENKQAQRRVESESSSSHASPSVAAKKAAEIPRRQQAFMEAIEAEARKNELATSRLTASSSSILSLYQEAKRLGMADPQAQWQYVQLLRHKHKPER